MGDLQAEMARVIVGQQYLIDRLLIGLLANGHVLLEGVPGLAKTLAVHDAGRRRSQACFQRIQFTPDLLPADLIGTLIYNPQRGDFTTKQGADLRQPRPGRRDQPRPGQGAERPARGHAGAAGDHRRRDLPAARAVPGAGHAEPHRAGGHLPAARGPGRPLHAQAASRLSRAARRSARSWTAWRSTDASSTVEAGDPARGDPAGRAQVVDEIYVDDKIKEYIVDLVFATREPDDVRPRRSRTSSTTAPRRARRSTSAIAARAHAFLQRPRLRHAAGRQGDRPRTCCATGSSSPTRPRPRK